MVLNKQTSSLENILAGVPQDSVFGPLLLASTSKTFADGQSLFSKDKDKQLPNLELYNNLDLISK